METYENKYKEALQRAKDFHSKLNTELQKDVEAIFPELKESEDERIRKGLIAFITDFDSLYLQENYSLLREGALAWLEKQCGQKPTLPKWKYKKDHTPLLKDSLILNKYGCVAKSPSGAIVSDVWIIDYDELAKLPKEEIKKQGEHKSANKDEPKFKVGDWITDNNSTFQIVRVENEWYHADDGDKICFDVAHQYYHLWTIQDAKDGDVLYLQKDGKEHIIIYKGVIKERFSTFVSAYCAYNGIVDAFCFADVSRYIDIAYGGIMPATKEQRDQLEKAMADAGYTFDFEKKELKKVEQKPTDLKTKAGNWYICDMEVMNENMKTAFHRDEIYYCPKDGYLDVGGALFEVGCLDVFRLATEKEIPQPKHEWNEEDSRILGNLKSELTNLVARGLIKRETEDKYVNWLDSLKPQNRWKPSIEQIEALEDHAINCYATISPTSKIDMGALMLMIERLKELTD